jgi:hypothetical protein
LDPVDEAIAAGIIDDDADMKADYEDSLAKVAAFSSGG